MLSMRRVVPTKAASAIKVSALDPLEGLQGGRVDDLGIVDADGRFGREDPGEEFAHGLEHRALRRAPHRPPNAALG